MSWSYKITTLYIGFVILILSLVFISSRNKEELVSKDYYAQELKYQQRIDAINNANSLGESILHKVSKTNITLALAPSILAADLKGEIYFYCPANASKDLKLPMNFDKEYKQVIPVSALQAGIYQMKLEWTAEGKNYFKEEVITINK